MEQERFLVPDQEVIELEIELGHVEADSIEIGRHFVDAWGHDTPLVAPFGAVIIANIANSAKIANIDDCFRYVRMIRMIPRQSAAANPRMLAMLAMRRVCSGSVMTHAVVTPTRSGRPGGARPGLPGCAPAPGRPRAAPSPAVSLTR